MSPSNPERGSVWFVTTIGAMSCVGIVLGMLTVTMSADREYTCAVEHIQRLYLAEAGISATLVDLATGGGGGLGSDQAPVPFGCGSFWTRTVVAEDGSIAVTSAGVLGGETRVVRSLFRRTEGGRGAPKMG